MCLCLLFSSPEPKAQVSYCHSAPSVVVRLSVNFYIFNFFSKPAWLILMKLGRDELLMVLYKHCCFSARSAQGRIQGGAKIGHRGPCYLMIFYAPGLKGPPRASSNWIVRLSVCLSVRPSVRYSVPLRYKVQYFKLWWSYSNQTWTLSSFKGFSHFTDITCPWGWGGVKIWDLRDFARF